MPEIYASILRAVSEGRYVVGQHADLRLRERRIEVWQMEAAMADAELLAERPSARPNPAVELRMLLPDGTAIKSVWSWLSEPRAAKPVTVHYFDR